MARIRNKFVWAVRLVSLGSIYQELVITTAHREIGRAEEQAIAFMAKKIANGDYPEGLWIDRIKYEGEIDA